MQWRRRRELRHRTGVFLCCYDVVISDDTRGFLDRVLRSHAWFATVYLSVMLSITLLTLRHWVPVHHQGEGDRERHPKTIQSPVVPALEVALGAGTCLVFVVEQLLRLVVLPPFECWPVAKQIELVLSAAYCFGVMFEFSRNKNHDPDSAASSTSAAEERTCSTLRILIVLRLLTISQKVRSEIGTTWRIRSTMVNFIFIAIVVMYIYACIGVSLLHGHLEPRHLYDGDPGENWIDDASVGQSIVNMNNYGDCFLALLQISVDNNWQDILWANTLESKHMSAFQRGAVGLYFCSFFVFMGWFGLNILTALVIETYDVAKRKGGSGGIGGGSGGIGGSGGSGDRDGGEARAAAKHYPPVPVEKDGIIDDLDPSHYLARGGPFFNGSTAAANHHASSDYHHHSLPTGGGAPLPFTAAAMQHPPAEHLSDDHRRYGGGYEGGGYGGDLQHSQVMRQQEWAGGETGGATLRSLTLPAVGSGAANGGDEAAMLRAGWTEFQVRGTTNR